MLDEVLDEVTWSWSWFLGLDLFSKYFIIDFTFTFSSSVVLVFLVFLFLFLFSFFFFLSGFWFSDGGSSFTYCCWGGRVVYDDEDGDEGPDEVIDDDVLEEVVGVCDDGVTRHGRDKSDGCLPIWTFLLSSWGLFGSEEGGHGLQEEVSIEDSGSVGDRFIEELLCEDEVEVVVSDEGLGSVCGIFIEELLEVEEG